MPQSGETLLMDKKRKHIEINGDNLKDYLGVQRVDYGRADTETAWAKSPGWRGRKWAAILLTIRKPPACRAKAS